MQPNTNDRAIPAIVFGSLMTLIWPTSFLGRFLYILLITPLMLVFLSFLFFSCVLLTILITIVGMVIAVLKLFRLIWSLFKKVYRLCGPLPASLDYEIVIGRWLDVYFWIFTVECPCCFGTMDRFDLFGDDTISMLSCEHRVHRLCYRNRPIGARCPICSQTMELKPKPRPIPTPRFWPLILTWPPCHTGKIVTYILLSPIIVVDLFVAILIYNIVFYFILHYIIFFGIIALIVFIIKLILFVGTRLFGNNNRQTWFFGNNRPIEQLQITYDPTFESVTIPDQAQPNRNIGELLQPSEYCTICLDTINDQDNSKSSVFILVCHHQLHRECYQDYVRSGAIKCPVCRQNIEPKKDEISIFFNNGPVSQITHF